MPKKYVTVSDATDLHKADAVYHAPAPIAVTCLGPPLGLLRQ
jgi:hypothetical protein